MGKRVACFNGESDYVHLIIDYKPDIALSKLIANLKTVSSRLIRKEFPDLAAKYFDNKPYFWTGAYFVASCGGVKYLSKINYTFRSRKWKRYRVSFILVAIHLPLNRVAV